MAGPRPPIHNEYLCSLHLQPPHQPAERDMRRKLNRLEPLLHHVAVRDRACEMCSRTTPLVVSRSSTTLPEYEWLTPVHVVTLGRITSPKELGKGVIRRNDHVI